MTGYQFYEEFRDEAREISLTHVIAVTDASRLVREGAVVCNAFRTMRSPEDGSDVIASVLLAAEYLGMQCREITEERARTLQPELFDYLERLA